RNLRSKTSDNGRESSSLPIPIDLIIDIFLRLPLKSIAICTNTYQTMDIKHCRTRQVLHLPKVKTRRLDVWSMFGTVQIQSIVHDTVKDGRDFQEHKVLTLGTRNPSWIECSSCIRHYDYSPPVEICINGVLIIFAAMFLNFYYEIKSRCFTFC
ncbi:hypothetical protein HID58_084081, partial [Brassica napus]